MDGSCSGCPAPPRKQPRFVNYARRNAPTPLDPTAFYEGVKALQGRHLGATLRLLSPVNQLNVFNVALTTAS
jgi:hypothetical protein